MSNYKQGDKVLVRSVNKNGVILEVRKNGSYLIAVGALNFTCKEKDIAPPSSARGTEPRPQIRGTATVAGKRPNVKDSIDLHGMQRKEALEALEEYLSNAVLAELPMVDIVHGIGGGVLKKAVHDTLAAYSFVKKFDVLPLNAGTTRAYLG